MSAPATPPPSTAPPATTAPVASRDAVLAATRAGRWAEVACDAAALLAVPARQGDPELWAALGQALTALDRLDEALEAFDRARALTPESDIMARLALLRERRVPFARRRALAMLADYDAQRAAAGGEAAAETAAGLAARLGVLWELERFPEVLAITRQLTALPDANFGQWLARGVLARIVLEGPERDAETRLAAERAVALAPDHPGVRLAAQALRRLPPPPSDLPPWLAERGFRLARPRGVEIVLPPLCAVPAGPFLMGSDPAADADAYDDEQPQHFVDLPEYAITHYSTTVAEYACFVRAGYRAPSRWAMQFTRPEYAVANVMLADAVAYAAWLAEQTGEDWRLPTEAEWEKAARWDAARRRSRIYPWGDAFDPSRANTAESRLLMPLAVGSLSGSASPCGAQDMAGNVWEWTSSLYRPYPYLVRDRREDERPAADHVVRGGAWTFDHPLARAACRGHRGPLDAGDAFGFRLVRAGPARSTPPASRGGVRRTPAPPAAKGADDGPAV